MIDVDSEALSDQAGPAEQDRPGWWGWALETAGAQGELLVWLTSLGLIGVSAITLMQRHVWRDHLHFFWDLKVYVATVQAQMAGLDPYAPTTLGGFGISPDYLVTSPPLITWLLGLLGAPWLREHAGRLLAAVHVGGLVATVWWSGRMFFGRGPAAIALAAAAYLGLFAATGLVSLGAANLGTVLHAAVLLALTPGLRGGRWRAALLTILLAALFKPFYLAYLLVPVAAQGWNWRLAGLAALVCAAALGGYAMQAWLAPVAFREWLDNVVTQMVVFGDIGLNLLGTRAMQGRGWLPHGVQVLAIAGFVALAVFGHAAGRVRWAVLLVVAVFVNPRMMPYDLAVAAVPLAFLAGQLAPAQLRPWAHLALGVGVLAAMQVSSFYPGGIDPHWAFPVTALLLVAAASWPSAQVRA